MAARPGRRVRALACAILFAAAGVAGLAGCRDDSASAVRPPANPADAAPRTTHQRASHLRAALRPPARPPRRVPRHTPVPILMYHVVESPPPGTPYPELWVPGQSFAAHVAALAGAGYEGVTLDEVDAHWRRGDPLPRRPVVFSFDDGYESQYTRAAPVLRARRWPGVLNLEVGNLEVEGGISERMVRELVADGWEVDAHTLSHPDLRLLDPAALEREVAGSRQAIRRIFGVPANFFCYPSGLYDAEALAAVRAAGFRGATTTQPGLARPDERFELRRVRVNGSDPAATVLARVAAAGSYAVAPAADR